MQVEKKLLFRKNKIRHSEGCERHFKTLKYIHSKSVRAHTQRTKIFLKSSSCKNIVSINAALYWIFVVVLPYQKN